MTSVKADLIGKRFGKLLVTGSAAPIARDSAWSCVCDCGTETSIRSHNLTAGRTKSCGCLKHEIGFKDIVLRFFENVRRAETGPLIGGVRCLEWIGSTNDVGYGQFKDQAPSRKLLYAHRWSYAKYKSELTPGLFVCHKCDNPPCVEPAHLFLGESVDNIRDAISKGRMHAVLDVDAALEIADLRHRYAPTDIAKILNLPVHLVAAVLHGRAWSRETGIEARDVRVKMRRFCNRGHDKTLVGNQQGRCALCRRQAIARSQVRPL